MKERQIVLFLFIYFFTFYALFIHWPGMNENSRFFLIRAIVDNHNLSIDPWYNQTTDRAFYEGHYYSDKPPGTSFLGLPIYWIVEKLFGPAQCNLDPHGIRYAESTIYRCKDLNTTYSLSMILLTLTSSLFGALLVSLFFYVTKILTKKIFCRFFTSIILGITSPLLPSSLVFQECSVLAFLSFLSFYFLIKRKYVLSSALLAISVLMSYGAIILLIPFIFFMKFSKKYKFSHYLSFTLIFILFLVPMFFYNFKIFSHPFKFPLQYNDRKVWKVSTTELKLFGIKSYIPDFYVTLSLLFLPPRGLIFFFPVYIGFFLGMKYLKKNFLIPILILFIVFLYYLSCRDFWWGGYFFGPKYFAYFIPFFTIPLLCFVEKHKEVILPFFLISLILSISSLTWWDDIIDFSTGKISKLINSEIHSFTLHRYDPFEKHYIPALLHYGPISRVVVSLGLHKIDIRDTPGEYSMSEYLKFKDLNTILLLSFLFVLLLFLCFEWKSKKEGSNPFTSRPTFSTI